MNPRRIRLFLVGLLFLFIVAALVFPLMGRSPLQTNAKAQTSNQRAGTNPSRPLPNYDAFAEGRGRDGAAARGANQSDGPPQVEAGRPVQYEPRLDVPTFLWASKPGPAKAFASQDAQQRTQDAASVAREHLGGYAPLYRLSEGDVATAKVASVHDTGRGAVVVKFRHEVGGVEVFRDELNVVMNRDLQLVALTGYLTGDGAGLSAPDFNLRPAEALSKAVEDLTGTALSPSALHGRTPPAAPGEDANPYTLYTGDAGDAANFEFTSEPSRVKQVMFHLPDGYVPAYYVETSVLMPSQDASVITATGEPLMTEVAYSYVISATDGQVLFRNNLVANDTSFTYRVWADPTTKIPYDTPAGNGVHPKVTATPDGFQSPFASPNDVTLQNFPFSKNDPWLPSGATETNGNNVDAFLNLFNPDGYGTPTTTTPADPPNGDYRAQITAANQFLHTHAPDVDASTANARQGSIQQLFYNINFLHDWFYDAGFDEPSGNAQTDNYGRGGLGGDNIKGQAQDFNGFSNANMATPADGSRPRMRMYVFPNPANHLEVQSPAGPAAGKYNIGISMSGLQNYDVTQEIVKATFTSGPSTCTITNAAALDGKLAMFDFDNTDGTGCSFVTRITRISATNAAGIIMVYTAGSPTTVANITGFNTTFTKGTATISWNSGQTIKTAMAGGAVTARLYRAADRDGSIDNQIVSHEWGHYISNRLIGNANGLNANLAGGLGEGWGDFTAMLLTVRADDTATASDANWNGAYALATYATSGVPFNGAANQGYYYGIRRYPYSTDMNINPLTYKHITNGVALPTSPAPSFGQTGASNSEVHNTGEVWSEMLWECYASLLRDTQGPAPRLTFSEAQTRMKNYLVAAYKMTPVSPTLLEARDAVILAAFTNDYRDGQLFAQAFAKRGAGLGAVSPDRESSTNAGAVESFEVGGALAYAGSALDDSSDNCDNDGYLDNGEKGLLKVTLKNVGDQNLFNTTATVSSNNPHVTFPDGATVTFGPSQPGQSFTGSVVAAVSGASGVETSDFTITFEDTGSPAVAPAAVHFFGRVNVDEAPAASATDTVEARQTLWSVTNTTFSPLSSSMRWLRDGGSASVNHVWHVPDPATTSEQFLTSPIFTVNGGGSVNLQFDHSWDFEFSGGTNYDGGVVEMSVNGGAWNDIGAGAYNGTLASPAGGTNPLKGRSAFVRSSGGTVHTSLTQAVAPGSTVQFRYRFGADAGTGAGGWNVDNIAFSGVVETPFAVLVADNDVCHPVVPPGVTVTLSPAELPAAAYGAPYTVTIAPSGGTGPYTYQLTPAVLPAGLSSSVVAGNLQIAGTPTQVGTSLITVKATDNNGAQGSKTYTFTVGKGSSTTTVTASDATYDGNPHGATASVTGFGGLSQNLAVTYAGRNGTTYGPSTTAPTNVGDYTASASFAGDTEHNGSSDSKDFQITKAGQTINFAALVDKTFGDAAFNVGATGGASGNPVTFVAAGNCTSGGTNGTTITITSPGTCTVTASQAGNSNYNAAPDVARTFNIDKASQTINFAALTGKTFGDGDFAVSATATAGLAVSFNASGACTVTGASVHLTGAGTCTVTASQAGDSSYKAATDVPRAFNVNKATSTTTVMVSNAVYDGNPHGGTASVTGFGGLNQSIPTVTYTGRNGTAYGPSTTAPTGAGDYTASASFAGDADHEGSSDSKDFSVTKAAQTITFGSLSGKTFGDAAFQVSATGGASTQPVTFGATGNCTSGGTNGATITITGAGSCTVTASQAGNSNYNAAPNVQQSFNIGKGTATITLLDLSHTYNGTARAATATTNPSGLSTVTISYAQGGSPVAAPTNAGSYDVTATLSNADYQGNATGVLVISKSGQTINFGVSDKTFGDADFTVSAAATSGLAVSFGTSGACTNSGATIHLTGAGTCTVTASQTGNDNYNAATAVPQSFNINKASSTTTVTVADAFYDGNPHGATAAVNGFGGLNQSLTTLTYAGRNATTYGPSTTAPANTGDYTASASFSGDADHNGSNGSADFQITKTGQTITFGLLSDKTFGDADFDVSATATSGLAVSFTASGRCTISGPTVHLTGAGTCTVTASQAGDSNRAAAPNVERSFQVVKGATTVALASSVNPSDLGQSVTFTAAVTAGAGTPSGTVTFKDGATTLGTGTLNGAGVATLTTSALTAGPHTITAEYGGDSDHLAGTGTLDGGQTVSSAPTLNIGDVTLTEGDSGTKDAVFAVTLSASSTLTVTASYATSDGTAAQPGDYQSASGTLTFAPGETLKTVTVKVKGDTTSESDETFFVTLTGPANATVGGTGKGTATVINDDAAGGVLSFSAADYTVAEGAGSIAVTVERAGDTTGAASVEYATDDGGVPTVFVPCAATTGIASQRCDFTAAAGRLDFAAGEASKTFAVLVSDDTFVEGPETLRLILKNVGGGALLGTPSAATLTITDDDIASNGNPVDDATFFVRQHYHDFLNREPDTTGLQFWTHEITSCGTDAACVEARRINVSGAFFLSIEFQNTGYLVYRANVAAFGPTRVGGVVPVTSGEFLPDVRRLGEGVVVGATGWEAKLETNTQAYFREFVTRPAFKAAFPSTLTPAQFVDALNANAGGALSQSERDALVAEVTANDTDGGRASVLRKAADDADLKAAEKNRAFVLMQYFGYLRRDPNSAPDTNFNGYSFWLAKLNQFGGDFVKAEMVKAFISSAEYRQRFGQ